MEEKLKTMDFKIVRVKRKDGANASIDVEVFPLIFFNFLQFIEFQSALFESCGYEEVKEKLIYSRNYFSHQ